MEEDYSARFKKCYEYYTDYSACQNAHQTDESVCQVPNS